MADGASTRCEARSARGGRTIIISGGARGIGRAVAVQLRDLGDRVAILDVDRSAAMEVLESESAPGPMAMAVECDVSDDRAVGIALDAIVETLGPVDGVVASAGIDVGGLAHSMAWDQWDRILAVNLSGAFSVVRRVIGLMIAEGRSGSVVCVSSPAAEVALPQSCAYSASKAGVSALVRCLAVDYARQGIRVNGVAPGPTDTDLMWANTSLADRERVAATVSAEVPIGRIAGANEVAEAIVWLMSERASYVTGAILACDGGVLAKASVSV